MSPQSCIPIKPTQEVIGWLDESWGLNPSGKLVWIRDGRCRNIKKGSLIYQMMEPNGYIVCRTSTNPRKKIRTHHLVWYYSTGQWPDKAIDHIDNNRSNNSFNNLRLATRKENSVNRLANKGKDLPKGVYLKKTTGKYVAMVADCYAGLHDTPEAAREAAFQLGQTIYGGFYK